MKKVNASLNVSIMAECPNCEAYLDLFLEEEANVLNDEGQLWDLVRAGTEIRKINPWKEIGIECTCYKCKNIFIFDSLEY